MLQSMMRAVPQATTPPRRWPEEMYAPNQRPRMHRHWHSLRWPCLRRLNWRLVHLTPTLHATGPLRKLPIDSSVQNSRFAS